METLGDLAQRAPPERMLTRLSDLLVRLCFVEPLLAASLLPHFLRCLLHLKAQSRQQGQLPLRYRYCH